jgi:sulfopyruvate decarboxylase TPP-binding subunit
MGGSPNYNFEVKSSANKSGDVMFEGPAVVAAFKRVGITHVVWIPDTELGRWDQALSTDPGLHLIRVCREGEALAVAAGLMLGGKRPIILMQCTGLFEAGDALRNFVHDLGLPLFLVVGVRGLLAARKGSTGDTCPVFAEPIVRAWQVPYQWLEKDQGAEALASAYRQAWDEGRPGLVLLPE